MTAPIGNFYANPYSALDSSGRPAGAYPLDPSHANGRRAYVGGVDFDAKRTVITQKGSADLNIPSRQTTVMSFTGEPTRLPITAHYQMGVRTGDLIAGDLETAKACGVSEKDFLSPEAALSAAREAAIAKWLAAYGEKPRLIDEDAEAARAPKAKGQR